MRNAELAASWELVAMQLRTLAEPFAGDDATAPVTQLVPLGAEVAVLVGYIQNTTGDPLGTGRHNLEVLRGLATRLAEVADLALADEPRT